MNSLKELNKAVTEGKQLKWNDPDTIEGNDYTITYIEDLSAMSEKDIQDYTILIQYGGCSQAEVYLSEINLVE